MLAVAQMQDGNGKAEVVGHRPLVDLEAIVDVWLSRKVSENLISSISKSHSNLLSMNREVFFCDMCFEKSNNSRCSHWGALQQSSLYLQIISLLNIDSPGM